MSSSSSSNSYSNRKGVGRVVYCKCGIVAPSWEAWKNGTLDPGRRFYGGSRYKEPCLKCNFFQWADPPYMERGREVIEEMKKKLSVKSDELLSLDDDLSIAEKELSSLKDQLFQAENKSAEIMELLLNKEKEMERFMIMFYVIVFSCVVMCILCLCNCM